MEEGRSEAQTPFKTFQSLGGALIEYGSSASTYRKSEGSGYIAFWELTQLILKRTRGLLRARTANQPIAYICQG